MPAFVSALVHDLGKSATPPAEWPKHHGHERRGVSLVRNLCDRLRVPTRVSRSRLHGDGRAFVDASTRRASTGNNLKTPQPAGWFVDLTGFDPLFWLASGCARTPRGASIDYPSDPLLEAYLEAARSVDLRALAESPLNAEAKNVSSSTNACKPSRRFKINANELCLTALPKQ